MGWASWPGLQCQDPTLFSVPLLPRTPVCSDPPLPVLVLQTRMKQVLEGAKHPVPECSPSPCNSIFLLVLLTSVDTADTISDLAKISVRQSWAQAARLSKVILGAPTALSWRGGGAAGQAPGRLHCQLGVAVLLATGSWAEGLALQVNLLTWWLWLAVGGGGPSRSSEKLSESGDKGCNHLEGRAEGAAGWAHGESRATSPAQLHQPPLGGHIFGGGNCPGLPPTTPCRASRWPMGPGTLPRLGQSREASSTEGTITWPRGVRWSGCQGAGVFGLLSGDRGQSGQRRWGQRKPGRSPQERGLREGREGLLPGRTLAS